jgi:hypothetical protein
MDKYEKEVRLELEQWQREMQRHANFVNRLTRKAQTKVNSFIPEKIHQGITVAIRQMVHGVLFGAEHTTPAPLLNQPLAVRELLVREKIDQYRKAAAAEGGITGAGGILLGLADFPLLLGIKIKLLFSIASLYGVQTKAYQERVYLLHIFQLAFSSKEHRRNVYQQIVNWQEKVRQLPGNLKEFDWRTFQQEYRDHIDLAKMAQLVPLIGAPVGAIVNYNLVKKLGITAMNAYRMRWFDEGRRE